MDGGEQEMKAQRHTINHSGGGFRRLRSVLAEMPTRSEGGARTASTPRARLKTIVHALRDFHGAISCCAWERRYPEFRDWTEHQLHQELCLRLAEYGLDGSSALPPEVSIQSEAVDGGVKPYRIV